MVSSKESERLLHIADDATETGQQTDYSSAYRALKTVALLLIYVCRVSKIGLQE